MNNPTSFATLDTKVENLINQASIPERVRAIARRRWHELEGQKLNVMVTGGTGSGKSSTINAMFNMGSAKVVEVAIVGTAPIPRRWASSSTRSAT